jgi:hypothetical protein
MMKRLLSLAVCFILLASIAAYSSSIEVGVREILKGSALSITYDNTSSAVRFSTEFYNTGSVGYKARMRLHVLYNDSVVFEGWSQEEEMSPGEKKDYNIYWDAEAPGTYSAEIRAYFGNEMIDYKKFDFNAGNTAVMGDSFAIDQFRTYDDHIVMDVRSNVNSTLVVLPSDYTNGWIFEQKDMGVLGENATKTISIHYIPTPWSPSSVNLIVMSKDGKYCSEKTFEMKREQGLVGLFFSLIDGIKLSLSA